LALDDIRYDVRIKMAIDQPHIKKFFSMTAEALGPALLEKKLIDEKELARWIQEMKRIEADPEAILLLHPAIAVWGTKV
jgi:hypothetical protein